MAFFLYSKDYGPAGMRSVEKFEAMRKMQLRFADFSAKR